MKIVRHLNESLARQLRANHLIISGDRAAGLRALRDATRHLILALHHLVLNQDSDDVDNVEAAHALARDLALSDLHFAGMLQALQHVESSVDGGAGLARSYEGTLEDAAELINSVFAGAVIGTIRAYFMGADARRANNLESRRGNALW